MSLQFEKIPGSQIAPGLSDNLQGVRFWYRESKLPRIRISAVGDIGLSGRIQQNGERNGYSALFQDIKFIFHQSDIVFGNLETPLLNATNANMQPFAASVHALPALIEAGFTLLNLANNHIYDFGAEGLNSTIEACRFSNIQILGAGKTLKDATQPVYITVDGIKTGWLGCGHTLVKQDNLGPRYWELEELEILKGVEKLRPHVDVLIVSLHLGLMYLDYPRPEHKLLAEQLQQAGADLIFMHHAHVLQGVQASEQGKTICYNLGNFILDNEEGNVVNKIMVKEQKESAVFIFDVDKQGVVQAMAIPIYTDKDFCVNLAQGERGDNIIERLCAVSKEIEGEYLKLFDAQRVERNVMPMLNVALFHLRKGNWGVIFDQIFHIRLEHIKMLFSFLVKKIFQFGSHEQK